MIDNIIKTILEVHFDKKTSYYQYFENWVSEKSNIFGKSHFGLRARCLLIEEAITMFESILVPPINFRFIMEQSTQIKNHGAQIDSLERLKDKINLTIKQCKNKNVTYPQLKAIDPKVWPQLSLLLNQDLTSYSQLKDFCFKSITDHKELVMIARWCNSQLKENIIKAEEVDVENQHWNLIDDANIDLQIALEELLETNQILEDLRFFIPKKSKIFNSLFFDQTGGSKLDDPKLIGYHCEKVRDFLKRIFSDEVISMGDISKLRTLINNEAKNDFNQEMEIMYSFDFHFLFNDIKFQYFSCPTSDKNKLVSQVKSSVTLLGYIEKIGPIFSVLRDNKMTCLEAPNVQELEKLWKDLMENQNTLKLVEVDKYLKNIQDKLCGLQPDDLDFFQQVFLDLFIYFILFYLFLLFNVLNEFILIYFFFFLNKGKFSSRIDFILRKREKFCKTCSIIE